MEEKQVQFSQDIEVNEVGGEKPTDKQVAICDLQSPKDRKVGTNREKNRKLHFSPLLSPSQQRINIAIVTDQLTTSVTLCHRRALLECVKSVCADMKANLVLVTSNELNTLALDLFYDADAAIIDISIESQRNSLYYHLGVRESFSMKQNILVVANVVDNEAQIQGWENDQAETNNLTMLTHEAASQIKSTLPNYPLFVYFIEATTSGGHECFVDQQFIDLSYSPGSDEQMDPSIPDFDDTFIDLPGSSGSSESFKLFLPVIKVATLVPPAPPAELGDKLQERQSLHLSSQLKESLKNVKWQAKVHMKEKFLADLRKVRELYQGEELHKMLCRFRRRLADPNMLNAEIVQQMLVSFQEVQDYNSMVQLVDELNKFPSLAKITSSPLIVFHHAFALNRRGDSDRALKLITNALQTKEHQVPDSICLCGRIFKDRFIESAYEDRDSLRNAIDWYRKGFKISPNEYAAINLATLLYIAGHDFNSSNELKHVGLVLNNLIGKKGPVHKLENYWDVATYFEFCLLANQFSEAIEAAQCMFNLRPPKWHLKSTIGNVRLIYQFKPRQAPQPPSGDQSKNLSSSMSSNCGQQEAIQSPEEQIVEFWTDFFMDAVLESCEDQIRFAALVFEQDKVHMPTYITMNLDAEEKSITISQMCVTHLSDLNGCRKPHLWHIKATGVRGISLYKRDERCVFLYVHDNSDDFQIFFPSESIRARFHSLVLSITGDRNVDISENSKETERKINFVYELDKDNNRIVLGRGSKGVVYAARDVDTKTHIAIKEIPVKNIAEVQPLHEEIRLHSLLRHRNIVQYLGTSHEGSFFRIIMERVPGGSLSQLLQREREPLKEEVIASYSRQILEGLQYLHRQKIVHRDIKGDNVLVNDFSGTVKISDFGTCKRLAAINPNTETFAGTVPFMAPELLDRGQRGYSMPADIWSFGCTVVEMASGKPPFIEIGSGAQVMFRVGFYKEHPEIPARLSEKCKQFTLRCFEPNTKDRATCDELLIDPFLADARSSSTGSSSGRSLRSSTLDGAPGSPVIAHRERHTSWPSWIRDDSTELVDNDVGSGPKVDLEEEFSDEADDELTLTEECSVPTLKSGQPNGGAPAGQAKVSQSQNSISSCDRLISVSSAKTAPTPADSSSSNGSAHPPQPSHAPDTRANLLATSGAGRCSPERPQRSWTAGEMGNEDVLTPLEPSVGASRQKLVELNGRLADENRKLWSRLYQVQAELRDLLTMQVNDKEAQLLVLKSHQSVGGEQAARQALVCRPSDDELAAVS